MDKKKMRIWAIGLVVILAGCGTNDPGDSAPKIGSWDADGGFFDPLEVAQYEYNFDSADVDLISIWSFPVEHLLWEPGRSEIRDTLHLWSYPVYPPRNDTSGSLWQWIRLKNGMMYSLQSSGLWTLGDDDIPFTFVDRSVWAYKRLAPIPDDGHNWQTYGGDLRVVGLEEVTVPAGTFRCWKVTISESGFPEKEVWYISDVGPVRLEHGTEVIVLESLN